MTVETWTILGSVVAANDGSIIMSARATSKCGKSEGDYYACRTHEAFPSLYIDPTRLPAILAVPDMVAAIEAVLASNTDSYAAARQQALDAFRKAKGLS